MSRAITMISVFCFFSLLVSALKGQPLQHEFTYQGRLTDHAGKALDSVLQVTFRLYADSQGGISLWSETHDSVRVEKGVFSALLGTETSLLGLFDGQTRWLGVTLGSEAELSPRTTISPSPYAIYSIGSSHSLSSDSSSLLNGMSETEIIDSASGRGFSRFQDSTENEASASGGGTTVLIKSVVIPAGLVKDFLRITVPIFMQQTGGMNTSYDIIVKMNGYLVDTFHEESNKGDLVLQLCGVRIDASNHWLITRSNATAGNQDARDYMLLDFSSDVSVSIFGKNLNVEVGRGCKFRAFRTFVEY